MSKGCEKINTLTRHPVVDDYIRNFLQVKGLSKTLEAFQIEWIESIKNGNIVVEDAISVPSVYQQNLQLLEMISNLKREVEVHKAVAQKANSKFQRLKHERDFHKMHHNRVEQEKSKMLIDIKRVKKQYEHYDPALQELKSKYATAVKERMLMKLEKDKLIKRVILSIYQ